MHIFCRCHIKLLLKISCKIALGAITYNSRYFINFIIAFCEEFSCFFQLNSVNNASDASQFIDDAKKQVSSYDLKKQPIKDLKLQEMNEGKSA